MTAAATPPRASATTLHPAFWRSAFEEHSGTLLGYLTSRLGRRDLAEDLLQETFARAIRAGALRDASKVRAYLLSVAHRLVVDHLRRRRPVLFSEMPGEGAEEGIAADEAEAGAEATGREIDLDALSARLDVAVDALPEPLRLAFRAAVLAERPYAEVAAELGWSRGRLRVNVHRARQRVIAHLRGVLQVDPGESP